MLLLLLPLLLLSSCEYKELCYDHRHYADVTVRFDWEAMPDADFSAMTVLFYDLDKPGSDPIRYDFAGMEGGQARLLPGRYQAIAYNYDTETILYRGTDDMNTLEAYTRYSSIEEGTQLSRAGMPRASSTEDEPVILEPDPLCGAVSEPFSVEANEQVEIVMPTHERVKEMTVTIVNVPNLQYTGQFAGAMSGLAPSVNMASGIPGEGRATQAFTASVVGESTLEMHFRYFGHCPHAEEGEEEVNPHILTVYAILADGTKWYYSVDVTTQMHTTASVNPDDQDDEVNIEIDGLPVPKPIVNGSGFQPTIDGWQGIEIPVGM